MASVHQAEEQLRLLGKKYDQIRHEAEEETRRIAEENRQNLENLKAECEQKLASDRQNTAIRYQELLSNAVRDIRNEKEDELRRVESDYYALKMEVENELRNQKQEIQKISQTQEQFQKQYEDSLELSRKIADEQVSKASEKLREFDDTEPYEWFPPNNRNLFYEHLNMAVQCKNNGLFQAAVGVADSLVMTIEIEQNRIRHLFDRWVTNFSALKILEAAEKKMIMEEVRDAGWINDDLKAEWEVADVLSDDTIRYWIKSDYFRYVGEFESDDDDILADFGDLAFDGTEKLRKKVLALMRARKSIGVAAEDLYKKSTEISVRLSYESRYICAMRSRIAGYDERCNLKTVIDYLFSQISFINTVNRFENDDPRDTLILVYENINREDQAVQIFVVPVFSQVENKWYNDIGYCTDIEDNTLRQQISDMLIMNLQETNALYEENGQELTIEQLSGRFKQHFNSAVNGYAVGTENRERF